MAEIGLNQNSEYIGQNMVSAVLCENLCVTPRLIFSPLRTAKKALRAAKEDDSAYYLCGPLRKSLRNSAFIFTAEDRKEVAESLNEFLSG